MADEFSSESDESRREDQSRLPGRSRRPATGAEAHERLRDATGSLAPELVEAAERAVARYRSNILSTAGQIGFLDDVVDFVNEATDVTEEIINHIAANTEEITAELEEVTPEVTPVTVITIGLIAPADGDRVDLTQAQREASAAQLLEARLQILDTRDSISERLQLIAQSLRGQLSAPKRPKS